MLLDAVSGCCKWSGLALAGTSLPCTTPVAFCVRIISKPIVWIPPRRWNFRSGTTYNTSVFCWIRQFPQFSFVPLLWNNNKHRTSRPPLPGPRRVRLPSVLLTLPLSPTSMGLCFWCRSKAPKLLLLLVLVVPGDAPVADRCLQRKRE